MKARYNEYSQLNLPAIGKEVLKKWEEINAFEKSIEIREGKPQFVFYEGPPSANGMPGIHHVISRTLKDLVCRYKTMQGYQVKRKGGWDTHGLPIELGVEKLLGITKEDIGKKISVEEYNAICRREVLRFKDKWAEITKKMGYWVDLEHPYITFENNYIETLWWCLKELYNKNLLYEDLSIQPYSPAAGTGLSSHELNQPGTYKDVKDTSAVVMFKAINFLPLKGGPISDSEEAFFLAWTTTPWTLPSNLGLTVGKNIDYVLIKTFNPYTHLPINVILAKAAVNKYFKPEDENGDFENYSEGSKILPWKLSAEFKGKELEGCRYEQLLPFEANSPEQIQLQTPGADPFKVITGDFVTTEDGTGIVHTAPAFGADDFKAGKKNNLGILILVDKEGKFIEGTGEFSGRFVKDYKDEPGYIDVNVDICVKLKKENRAFKIEKYEHNYPHCWRTDKPVIYYPLDAWFIKTTALKERMIELNNTINWKPASTGTGRFGNWLENMVDWNLSRSRFWGTPLPIWRTEDGTEEKCVGSIEELNTEIRKANEILGGDVNKHYLHQGVLDLHKPYVDEIILVSATGKIMTRVPDLIDVWFDSGAMPYAQWHFPFENKETFRQNFPADFIAEGVDQTRGWFYTLHVLGALLFDSVAYKTVVSNGLVLDKNGNKMSKRLGNVVDPFETLDKFGADATRWYLITNASPWDSLRFDVEGIKEVQRKFFGTLYHTYQFFTLYANVDGFTFSEKTVPVSERSEIDRWILSSLNTLVKTVEQSLDDYEPTEAGRAIENFVDEQLSNWYVRLCRRRFWKGDYELDKICAYQTLYECVETLSRLIAPVAPFFADWLFGNLNMVTKRFPVESVHHTDFPKVNAEVIDISLEKRMQLAQDVSSLILSLRKKVSIKVRQPLQKALIPVVDDDFAKDIKLVEDIIKAETNIKEVEILSGENNFIKKRAKANFKTLGKKLGSKMKWAAEEIQKLNDVEIQNIQDGDFLLNKDFEQKNEQPVFITREDIEVTTDEMPGYEVASKGAITVALDVTLTPLLKMEGEAREFVSRIQHIRKDQNLEVTDKIFVKVSENERFKASFTQFNTYICAEILADKIDFVPEILAGTSIDVNDTILKVNVIKKEDYYGNNKKNKGIAKKVITKKSPLKKAVKKAIPVKKVASKKPVAKKAVTGKVKAKISAKVVKPAKKAAPVKKISKPIAKKAATKKPVAKKAVSKKPISKKAPVPVKKGIAPIDKKHMAVEKHNPKKEESKKVAETKVLPKAKDIKVPPPPPVVIPKITTTKARKYEPEFTKSVLDQAAPKNNGPTQRYSDGELNEFRELIQRKLETAKKELGYLQGLITRKDEMGGDETDNRYMTMEDGSLSMEREQLSQMASRQITFIDHLEKAMMRIENKTYGICRVTGKLIDKARLRAVPHATLSIEAKMGIVK